LTHELRSPQTNCAYPEDHSYNHAPKHHVHVNPAFLPRHHVNHIPYEYSTNDLDSWYYGRSWSEVFVQRPVKYTYHIRPYHPYTRTGERYYINSDEFTPSDSRDERRLPKRNFEDYKEYTRGGDRRHERRYINSDAPWKSEEYIRGGDKRHERRYSNIDASRKSDELNLAPMYLTALLEFFHMLSITRKFIFFFVAKIAPIKQEIKPIKEFG